MQTKWRWVASLLLCVLAIAAPSMADAQAPCRNCNPVSRHEIQACHYVDRTGQPVHFTKPDVLALLRQECVEEDEGNDTPLVSFAIHSCIPRVPDPAVDSFGGLSGTYKADTYRTSTYIPTGQTLFAGNQPSVGVTCGCHDSKNLNFVALGNDGACYCKEGRFWDEAQGTCVVAPPDPTVLAVLGPTETKALPAGPVLEFVAGIKKGGVPVADRMITLRYNDGSVNTTAWTDSQGLFPFTYVPPVQRAVELAIVVECSGCDNSVTLPIKVDYCEVCDKTFGNPIQPATGEKQQDETDWVDHSPHPLTLTRMYRSQGNANAGLGVNWSHNFAGIVDQSRTNRAIVRLGHGRDVRFTWDAAWRVWRPTDSADRLQELPSGDLIYTQNRDDTAFHFTGPVKRLTSIRQRNGWTYTLNYPASGQLASVTNAFGRTLQLEHSASGLNVSTPDGKRILYELDGQRLSRTTGTDGSSRRYHYEDSRFPNAMTGTTDETDQRQGSFAYDEFGRATETKHADGTQRYTVNYPGGFPGWPLGLVKAGHGVDPSYYQMQLTVNDPNGTPQAYEWAGGSGEMARTRNSGPFEGETAAQRKFAGGDMPYHETDFEGHVTERAWDLGRRLEIGTMRAAGTPEQQLTETQWHPQYRVPVRVTEPGRVTTYTHDGLGNTLTETVSDPGTGQSRTWTWTYGSSGLVETMTEPNGAVWRYGYDSAGNRTSVVDPLGRSTTFTHDAAGRVLTQRDPGGLTTTKTYDTRGRLTSQNVGGEVSAYTYTPTGQLAFASLPDGHAVTYTYDSAQRLIAASDNRGAVVSYLLDAAGNRVREEVKDAGGTIAWTTSRVINSLNLASEVRDGLHQVTQFGFDRNGELVSETDPLNQTTRQTLDALKRTTSTTFADNASVKQAWNPLDQLTKLTDPKGVSTTYTYNAFGEVMSETSPDIGTIKYTRDSAGYIVTREDAKGNVARIERDLLGRPTQIEYSSTHKINYTYNEAGHVIKFDDKSGSSTFERDAHGRILSKTQDVLDSPTTPSRFRVSYSYEGGQLTGITYPSGLKVTYQRAAGRVTGVELLAPGSKATSIPFVSNLTYTALGQPKAWTWFNGDSANRSFDAAGRMTANEFASYTYDAAGRITGITQQLFVQNKDKSVSQVPLNWAIGYDRRNRLTSFVRDDSEVRYGYDDNTNRLTSVEKVRGGADLDPGIDDADYTRETSQALNIESGSNRLLGFMQTVTSVKVGKSPSVVQTPVTYTLDANGSVTSDGLRDLVYDERNRLAKVRVLKDGEAASIRYLHNAAGQRVFKGEPQAEQTLPDANTLGQSFVDWLKKQFGWMFVTAGSSTSLGTAYLYGDEVIPSWAILGEYDNGTALGAGRTEYIWLPMQDGNTFPIGVLRNGKLFAVHSDHLGTSRLITNEAKAVEWQWPYSSFGQNRPTGVLKTMPESKESSGSSPLFKTASPMDFNLAFPGWHHDAEMPTFYNNQRDAVDPKSGRYWQADPLGSEGGFNRFGYAHANSFAFIDPTGEIGVWGALIGSGIELAIQLALNEGRIECVDWWAVGVSGLSGAVGGAALNGVFRLSKGSMKWENVRRRYRRGHDVAPTEDVHHWAIERGGATAKSIERFFGTDAKNRIVNHPANLTPLDKATHQAVHKSYGPLARWQHGTPLWAKAGEAATGAGLAGESIKSCTCR